jgi:sodium pump decarboxylase gamma subunit
MATELISQGLMIAAIGMGLVFVVIIFLWGLMALLMRLTSSKEKPEADKITPELTDSALAPEVEQTEAQRRAAAAAVAVSLALAAFRKTASGPASTAPGRELSPWQAFHRSRQTNPEQRRG